MRVRTSVIAVAASLLSGFSVLGIEHNIEKVLKRSSVGLDCQNSKTRAMNIAHTLILEVEGGRTLYWDMESSPNPMWGKRGAIYSRIDRNELSLGGDGSSRIVLGKLSKRGLRTYMNAIHRVGSDYNYCNAESDDSSFELDFSKSIYINRNISIISKKTDERCQRVNLNGTAGRSVEYQQTAYYLVSLKDEKQVISKSISLAGESFKTRSACLTSLR